MKIYFSSYHKYPGSLHGVAAHSVHDNIVKGLGELGHDIYYQLKEKPEIDLPYGVRYSPMRIKDADIWHINDGPIDVVPEEDIPWVRVLHCDIRIDGFELDICKENWIYVSQTQANLYGSKRFVHNGINPDEFIFSETKDDYLFFIVGGAERANMKGLDIALEVARKTGIELKIAASSDSPQELEKFKALGVTDKITFVGPVYGNQKAELFAGAKAVLFPSRYNEACPLVISEALMSGTPIITSNNGACPELVNEKVGFVCHNEADYLAAISNIDRIDPKECRAYALKNCHYLRMAEEYVLQYQYELERTHTPCN